MANGWALLVAKLRSLGVDYKKKVEVKKSDVKAKNQAKGNCFCCFLCRNGYLRAQWIC